MIVIDKEQDKKFITATAKSLQTKVLQIEGQSIGNTFKIAFRDRESAIWRKVSVRAIVALLHIIKEQWQQKGFHKLPNSQNLRFQKLFNPTPRE